MKHKRTKNNRIVIIGIDGASYELIERLISLGVMPCLGKIIKEGYITKLHSSIPEVSSTAWSSIITGQNPGVHGIFGFMDLIPGTYSLSFPNFKNLRFPPFWDVFKGNSIIINVPSTYPARNMRGVHIAGFIAPDLNRAVYPMKILHLLRNREYRVDVDTAKFYKSFDLFMDDLFKTLEARIKIFMDLWRFVNWDIFMAVFTGSDRIEHFFWDAFENKDHKYHHRFLEFFNRIDQGISMIVEKLRESDKLIILSDHGMEKTEMDVNINWFLKEQGHLNLGNNTGKRYNNIKEGSHAFALDPARIYINRQSKYPNGSVSPSDEEQVLDDLVSDVKTLKWQGKRVVDKIYRKHEVYSGPRTEFAPDLVLIPNSGFNIRGRIDRQSIFDVPTIAGKHTLTNAFLCLKDFEDSDSLPRNPNLENIVHLIEELREQ